MTAARPVAAAPRVHDLVRVAPGVAEAWSDAPPWVHAALSRAPWVVCRRSRGNPDFLTIGVRGRQRHERYGAHVSRACILETLRPEDLVARLAGRDGLPAEVARRVAFFARAYDLAWGPTGSFGFELAANVATTHASSDLDLVVRGNGVARDVVCAFAAACDALARSTGMVIDAEIACGESGIPLQEYCGAGTFAIAKTPDGPKRIVCPP